MTYEIRYHEDIDWKKFRKLSREDRVRIHDAIERKLARDPLRFGKPLRSSLKGHRSLRIGNYRIIYRVEEHTVFVLLFGHRANVYKG
jgi:addiction module RelE/StbE family toxin